MTQRVTVKLWPEPLPPNPRPHPYDSSGWGEARLGIGSAITVFRGATAERRTGMSWTRDIDRADQFRQRHSWHAPTAVYRAVVMPDAVLALLERRGEGPPEVVVDPQMLTAVEQVGPLHPQRFRRHE